MRKALRRAVRRHEPELVTTNQIVGWLRVRLSTDPELRWRIKRVLAALQRAETKVPMRRRAR